MNKKDFWSLMACDFVSLVLLIEHLCGLEAAVWCLYGWTVISLTIHINIWRDYVVVHKFVREDHTR